MKILMVNKFLYPKGGAETYMIKLGEYFKSLGNEVQYFGMTDKRNVVVNECEQYIDNMDFSNGSNKKRFAIKNTLKVIYSIEARKKIGIILKSFQPDVVHLNNINYQITPSIIYEIKKHKIPIVQTVHDPQLVCPNHRLYIEKTNSVCEECLCGKFIKCFKNKCIKNSRAKSFIGMLEAYYYHYRNTYKLIDKLICPSKFISQKLIAGGVNEQKIEVLCNFSTIDKDIHERQAAEQYALYFGRLSKEKGIETLLSVCKELENVMFLFAGTGPLENLVTQYKNVQWVGFKKGKELENLISNAKFTIYPSECYENCPLSVIESEYLGTPVIGSNLGGIGELINHKVNGLIFEAGNKESLKECIECLWYDNSYLEELRKNCLESNKNSLLIYGEKLNEIYAKLIEK